jgi:hypothetical protein
MSTAAKTGIAEASPRCKARLAGVFEALEGMTSAFGQVFALGRLVVYRFPVIAAASVLAEIPLQRWLLAVGVNPQRWREQASAAGRHE